jgi:hypothetical protein
MSDQTSTLFLPSKAWLVLRLAWLVYIAAMSANLVIFFNLHSFFLQAADGVFTAADPMAHAETLDRATGIALSFQMTSFIIAMIGYGFFYHASMLNAQALEPEHATVSASGMWWWYIVPFANLWKPLEGVMQVWRVMRGRAGQDSTVPWVFALWWASWLVGGMSDQALGRYHPGSQLSVNASDAHTDIAQYYLWCIPAGLILIVGCAALWWISEKIYVAQKAVIEREGSPSTRPEIAETATSDLPAKA